MERARCRLRLACSEMGIWVDHHESARMRYKEAFSVVPGERQCICCSWNILSDTAKLQFLGIQTAPVFVSKAIRKIANWKDSVTRRELSQRKGLQPRTITLLHHLRTSMEPSIESIRKASGEQACAAITRALDCLDKLHPGLQTPQTQPCAANLAFLASAAFRSASL